MLQAFPFGSGSLVTASYAISASFAENASYLAYVTSASVAVNGTSGSQGPRGTDVCLLTFEQYEQLRDNPSLIENCPFPPQVTG